MPPHVLSCPPTCCRAPHVLLWPPRAVVAPTCCCSQVHLVKALFADKEQALQTEIRALEAERDVQARSVQHAKAQAEAEEARQRRQLEEMVRARQQAEDEARAAHVERERLGEQLASRTAECTAAREEKARVEGEMRLVLKAMDQQKAVASRNMAQLSHIYDEWNATVN